MATSIELREQLASMKDRLEELKAKRAGMSDKSATQAARYRAGADAVRALDPDRAMKYETMADALDQQVKANALEEARVNRMGTQTPDQIRQQLRISRDKAVDRSLNETLSQPQRDLAEKEYRLLSEEMAKPNPNAQVAFTAIDELYKANGVPTPIPAPGGDEDTSTQPTDYTGYAANIKERIGAINYKGQALNDMVAQLKNDVNGSNLAKGEKDALLSNIDNLAESKANPPASSAKVAEGIWKSMQKGELKNAPKALGFYQAGVSDQKSGSYFSAVGKYIKMIMGEAVNEGDIVNAMQKGGSQDTKNILRKYIGTDFASMKPEQAAENARRSAVSKLNSYKTSYDSFLSEESDEVKKLVNDRYFGGFTWNQNFDAPIISKSNTGGGVKVPYGVAEVGDAYYAIDKDGNATEVISKELYDTYVKYGSKQMGASK